MDHFFPSVERFGNLFPTHCFSIPSHYHSPTTTPICPNLLYTSRSHSNILSSTQQQHQHNTLTKHYKIHIQALTQVSPSPTLLKTSNTRYEPINYLLQVVCISMRLRLWLQGMIVFPCFILETKMDGITRSF